MEEKAKRVRKMTNKSKEKRKSLWCRVGFHVWDSIKGKGIYEKICRKCNELSAEFMTRNDWVQYRRRNMCKCGFASMRYHCSHEREEMRKNLSKFK